MDGPLEDIILSKDGSDTENQIHVTSLPMESKKEKNNNQIYRYRTETD